jgi:hypothetical protein
MHESLPRLRAIAILLPLATLPTCHQHLAGSGFLGTYVDMRSGRYLEAESHLPGLRFDGRASLAVQPVRPYLLASGSRASVQRLGDVFQAALAREIGGAGLYGRVFESEPLMPPSGTAYTLDAVITEIETGHGEESLRPGGGVPGARRISVEGRISELGSGRPVFKFKDTHVDAPRAARAGGDAEAEARLERDLETIARDVADSLRAIHAASRKAPGPPVPAAGRAGLDGERPAEAGGMAGEKR